MSSDGRFVYRGKNRFFYLPGKQICKSLRYFGAIIVSKYIATTIFSQIAAKGWVDRQFSDGISKSLRVFRLNVDTAVRLLQKVPRLTIDR